jgi:hypothetical protein
MGALDSIAGIMQVLAVNYISNGSLVTLLMQAAVPVCLPRKSTAAVMHPTERVALQFLARRLTIPASDSTSFVIVSQFSLSMFQVSMVISKIFLKTQYKLSQYFGALIVAGGLAVVLVPVFVDPPKVHYVPLFIAILASATLISVCMFVCLHSKMTRNKRSPKTCRCGRLS